MASMRDFAPGGRMFYSGQHEQIPPWEEQPLVQDPNKYSPSLFWKKQLERIPEAQGWYSDMPWWVQDPLDWIKRKSIESEIRTGEAGEKTRDVISGLGESQKERAARLDAERKKAAAEKFEKSQAERRMPTAVPSIPKIEEEEDLMDKYLKYMLMSSILGNTAGGEYAGTSSVSIGQARPWPTMTPMV